MTKVPDFAVRYFGPGPSSMTYIAEWEDQPANRRYHIWINENGELDEVICSNWINARSARHSPPTKRLPIDSKKWKPVADGIRQRIKAEYMLEAARAKVEAERQAQREAKNAAEVAAFRKTIEAEGMRLDDQGMSAHSENLLSLLSLEDEQLRRVCRAIQSTRH